jgi:beta-aspartyl-peptidase (threonine type)
MKHALLPLAALLLSACATAPTSSQQADWALIIHGGAGNIPAAERAPERWALYEADLNAAMDAGTAILKSGGSSLDAIEVAIVILEDSPQFNAGRGAVFTNTETNELDASVMVGSDRNAGAVAGVTRTKNPIRLARTVMEDSPHVMMAGNGADTYSREQGLEQVNPSYFRTERRLKSLRRAQARAEADLPAPYNSKFGTVGAVALDADGNLAAGTSTGGMTNKRWGRVGDVPVIGAGTYADNKSCAVSATGHGEYFIRVGVARTVCARMEMRGEDLQTAADHVIFSELDSLGGDGGIIALDPQGRIVWSHNSPTMYRASESETRARDVGID